MASFRSWLLAARPKTLPAAVAPVTAGTVLGGKLAGALRWDLACWALLSCLALQIATNLFNDAIDHKKGADTDKRLGPRRVTASGELSSRQVLLAALGVLILSGLFALPLWQERGWPIVAIGIPSLYLCYGYTGGPFPLAYRGVGDLFVLVFFGWVAVMGSCFLQTGGVHWEAFLLGTQIGLWSVTLIAINNLRDHEEDRGTGKHTLAVRLGPKWARVEITMTFLLPAMLGLVWWHWGWTAAAWWPLLALPLGLFIARAVCRTPPSPVYNRFLALSALHLLLASVLVTLGLWFQR